MVNSNIYMYTHIFKAILNFIIRAVEYTERKLLGDMHRKAISLDKSDSECLKIVGSRQICEDYSAIEGILHLTQHWFR